MKKRKASLDASLIFVLVGPLADAKKLATWAHGAFRKSAAVAFIGIDRGLKPLLASGLPATLAIGDFDGIGSLARVSGAATVPRVQLRVEKERSDLSCALDFCAAQGAQAIYAVGFQGGRADHDFAVHLDLSEASRRVARVVSIGEKGATMYLASRFSTLRLSVDEIEASRSAMAPKNQRSGTVPKWISIFPIGSAAKGVRFRGLRFPPLDGILSISSQGLSNEIRARKIEIGLRQGCLALFFPA